MGVFHVWVKEQTEDKEVGISVADGESRYCLQLQTHKQGGDSHGGFRASTPHFLGPGQREECEQITF